MSKTAVEKGLAAPARRPKQTTSVQEKEDGNLKSQKILLTWMIEDHSVFSQVKTYLSPEDFTGRIYREVAELLYKQYEEGSVNPARILNHFTDEEEHREAASLFHTKIRELSTKEEQEKAAAGEPVPDHENHLINFSYVRSLYVDQDGYEVNDCAVDTDSYTGTYGRELAKRDRAVYGECTLRAYSNVWLRSPVTNLESKTAMGAFEGNQKNGFTSRVQTGGKIRTDDSAALERFSLYVELPEGLVLNLNPDAVRVKGKGKYLSGEAVSEGDFQNHVSYQVRRYNKKTMLAADFDFSGAPLEGLKGVEAVLDFEVGLSYTDFISFGNQYRTVSYLMVHDDGLDKIAGTSIMTDVYDMDDNGSVLEQAAYSSDREVVLDSATEWREYVSKYVKSDYSAGYGTEAVVRAGDRSAQSGYSYRLDFGLGSNHAKNIDFFDSIEQGARLASHKPGRGTVDPSQWQGRFLFVDTSYAESMKLIPTVYYSTDEKQELRADADGWRKERPKDPGDVKAVWIHLDTSQLEYGLLADSSDDLCRNSYGSA